MISNDLPHGHVPVILYMSKAHMWVPYDLRRYVNRLLGTLEILGNSREFTNNSCGARHRKNYVLREFTGNSQLTTREFKSWRIQRQLNIRKKHILEFILEFLITLKTSGL